MASDDYFYNYVNKRFVCVILFIDKQMKQNKQMKFTVKIIALSAILIYALSVLGWAIAINKLDQWCDCYVAISLKPQTIATVTRSKSKAIAPKAVSVSIMIKETPLDYARMTTRELKKFCKGTGIKGWEKLRKAELVLALNAI